MRLSAAATLVQRTYRSEDGFAEESVNNTSDMARLRRDDVMHGDDDGWHEGDGIKQI
jgi:hypothetical protein